ncbi:MAG: hypothetical protein ACFCVK_17695 [Acidimicrobiales bacterium]
MRVSVRAVVAIVAAAVGVVACGAATDDGLEAGDHPTVVTRRADDVQVVPPDEAARLLDEGRDRVAAVAPAGPEATVAADESSRSFQTRLGTALVVFNGCLDERGFRFVGLPGETDDPAAADPNYFPALVACNNESGIAAVLQEQSERQTDLGVDDKVALNEDAKALHECMTDRGWDLGPLEANENGVLSITRFPDDLADRPDEFTRDLDACGWNDLDLG